MRVSVVFDQDYGAREKPDSLLVDDDALARFEDFDPHHPDWTAVDFVGMPLTRELLDQFAGYGVTVTTGDDAFSVGR